MRDEISVLADCCCLWPISCLVDVDTLNCNAKMRAARSLGSYLAICSLHSAMFSPLAALCSVLFSLLSALAHSHPSSVQSDARWNEH